MRAKTKLTRLCSILLTLVLLVGLLPTVALAEGPVTEKADFINNPGRALELLNAAKTGDTLSEWDNTNKILTLNGVNFTTTADTAVVLPDGATIVLNGENTIKGGDSSSSSEECYGIYVEGGLTIQGTGQLNVTAGDVANCDSYGISAYAVTISGGTVTANGGDTEKTSYGIYARYGDVTITGGTVTATGGNTDDESYGIYVPNGNVTISGGTVTATGGTAYYDSRGISGDVSISGGTVTATGGNTNDVSYGISGDVSISGGTVTAKSGTADEESYGIDGDVSISGGTVTATGGNSEYDSDGIYGDVSISSGIVTATGGTADDHSYGIDGTVNISGGTVIAKGVNAQWYSDGIDGSVTISGGIVTATGGNTTKAYGESYGIDGSVEISGGAVIAKAGSATNAAALHADSVMPPTTAYWWRTSDSDDYSKSAYTGDGSEAHLEIWNWDPTATADFTVGDGTAARDLLNAAKTGGAADSTWDNTTKTLTLKGVHFVTTAATAVKLPDDATIVLNGTNTITGGASDSAYTFGIYGEGRLTISGTGTLNVTGGDSANGYSYGIRADDVTISGGTVNAKGGTTGKWDSSGISASMTITGGTVNAKGGTANGVHGNSYGNSYGIRADDHAVSISGGIVTAEGGAAVGESCGIRGYTYLTISGGTVIAKAAKKALDYTPSALPSAYRWRTSDSGDYSEFPGDAYSWGTGQTYVEIKSNPTVPITPVAITGIDAPVSNNALDAEADCNTTGVSNAKPTVTWDPSDSKAGYGKIYTASITLTASEGYVFADSTTVTVNGNPATSVTKNANGTLTVTYTFPATAKHNIEITVDTDVRGGDAATNPTINSGYELICFFVEDTNKNGDFSDDKTWVVDKALVEAYVAQPEVTLTYDQLMATLKDGFGLDELKTEFTGGYDYSVYAAVAHSDGAGFEKENDLVTNAIVKINGTDKTAVCKENSDNIYFLPSTDSIVFTAGTPTTPTPPYIPPTYKVESEVTEDADGSVSFSKSSAKKGDTVTITVTPNRYYKVDGVTVKDASGKEIAVTDNGDGTFTFQMPASKVTVEPVFSWDNPFGDVAEDAYYAPAVEWALKNEITDGTSATAFSPSAGCTRAQAVTFLWRAAGCPEPADMSSFTDVSADAYYAKAVAWAVEQGITDGTSAAEFSPNETCSRSQIVTFLYRTAGSPEVSDNASFSDVEPNAYYAAAVAWAEQNGVTGGIGGGLFGSANDCTRGQIVTFLYRYFVK